MSYEQMIDNLKDLKSQRAYLREQLLKLNVEIMVKSCRLTQLIHKGECQSDAVLREKWRMHYEQSPKSEG